jgi:hypothetical protein
MTHLRSHNYQRMTRGVNDTMRLRPRTKSGYVPRPTRERAIDRHRATVTAHLENSPASARELQGVLGLANLAQVYGILGNLREEGTIEQGGRGRYRLAPKAVDTSTRAA